MPEWMKKNRCRKCSEERAVRFCLRNNKDLGWRCCNELRSDTKCPAACVYAPRNPSEKTGIPQLKTDSRTELIDYWERYLPRWIHKPVVDLDGKTAMELSATLSGKEALRRWLNSFGFPDSDIKAAIYHKLDLGEMLLTEKDCIEAGSLRGIANPGTQQITNLCYNVEKMASEYLDAVIAQDWQAVIAKHTLYQDFRLSDVIENFLSVLSRHPLLKKVTQKSILNAGFSENRHQAFVFFELNRKENWTMIYVLNQGKWHPYQHIWGTIQEYYSQKQHFKDIVTALASGNLTQSWDKISILNDRFPLSADLAYYRGLYYQLEKKDTLVRQSFEDAIAFDPTWEQPLHHLALTYIQVKEFEPAIKHLEQILKFYPADLNALNNLGVCYLGLGQTDQAKAFWQKALELDPENELLKKNIERLALSHPEDDKTNG